jgi:hypothetical protein
MGYTDQRLFRARALEPVAALGDVLYLLDQKGPLVKGPSAYYGVAGIEPVFGIGPHSMLLIYNQGGLASAPAGYGTQVGNTTVIPEGATGNIAASGSVQIANPKILQQGPGQLFQCRFALKPLALTGLKEHDVELQVSMPGSLGKFNLLQGGGFYNMADQIQDPSDVIDSPAQNANQTLPAAFPALHGRDQNNLTEMFIWELNGPTFKIFNNGSATLTAGSIGLRIWGFRYDLVPLSPDGSWVKRWVYNGVQPAPPVDRAIVVVQTATYTAQGSY